MKSVHEYIVDNWNTTIRPANGKIPYPYTTPCADELFVNFFYWDTYFTNLGLLEDGRTDQARNNLLVMNHFINTLGYIPNADHLLYRSQPPLFTRAVYDYVMFTGDTEIIRTFRDSFLKEYAYFDTLRKTPIGLYAYSSNEPKEGLDWYYDEFERRCGGFSAEEKAIDRYVYARSMLGIAESGWDFNIRFREGNVKFAAYKYAHLDLNCLLYDAFVKAGEMFMMIGDSALAGNMETKASELKKLINKYLYNEEKGIYLDYNYMDRKFSDALTVASLYPYALGVSDDKEAADGVFDRLIMEHGISTAEFRGKDATYFQWDYPAMWPPIVYFVYKAMNNVGDQERASLMKDKYVSTVTSVYEKTGKLWEKYDSLTGDVSVTNEYKTPTMMGWTAGVYEYLLKH